MTTALPAKTLIRGGPLALLLLAGCASIPDVGSRPEPRRADTIAAERSLTGSEAGAWPRRDIWAEYGDPQLAALIAEALRHSPDMAAASARLRRAVAQAQVAGAGRLPSLDAEGLIALDRQSRSNGVPAQFIPDGWNDRGQLAAVLDFDLDLWGRNRAALAAAVSESRAAAIDAAEARMVLGTAIASAYSDLAAAFAEEDVRRSGLNVREASRDLIARRRAAELENLGSLRQADAEVASARAALAQASAEIDVRRHQLAALIGAGPDRGLEIARPTLAQVAPRRLPEGVTTDLIGRRPDIVAARERVEAAAQRLNVAGADFYPAIRLGALVGLQSLGLANLADGGSVYGSVGPAFSMPIFHGGAIQGRYRVSRAEFDLAVTDYDRAVLAAYREVADAVTRGRAAAERLRDAREGLAASEEAYRVAQDRYRAGLSNYLQVLVVEDRLLDASLSLAAAESAVRSIDIALLRALGGGFSEPGAAVAMKGTPDA